MAATADSAASIALVYYSGYGHVRTLMEKVKEGIEKAGATARLVQVREKMHLQTFEDPVADVEEVAAADGVIFGTPTRFGTMASQMKAFLDASGGVWQRGGMVGKTAGVVVSTGTLQGGQETTALTMVPYMVHQGMVFVPLGYTKGDVQFDISEVHGGSPYGPTTFAGPDGSRQPSEKELALAVHYGEQFARTTVALTAGRAATAAPKVE